jgi:bifunctional non-homologous end joining protein LigD
MVVGGFIPGGGRHTGGIGTLLVGAHNDTGELVYAGHVGTGLSDRLRRTLLVRLGELTCADSPFTGPAVHPAGAHVNWVRPRVVVDVEYRQFTGRLRHPSLKGLAAVDPHSGAAARDHMTVPSPQSVLWRGKARSWTRSGLGGRL